MLLRTSLLLLLLLLLPSPASPGDLCTCNSGDDFDWLSVADTDDGGWSCSGGDDQPSPDDHFRIGAGCRVEITGDILQAASATDSGLEVSAGGLLEVRSNGDGPRVLSLGGLGLECFGECRLEGRFRSVLGATVVDPEPWTIDSVAPCDGDCAATPERACFGFASPIPERGLAAFRAASDLEMGTQDWLCFWDFDKSDFRVSRDDNACYPVASVDPTGNQVCVDARQGRDSEYPHRLRVIVEARLAAAVAAGDGCGAVLDENDATVAPGCAGSVLRIDPAPGLADPIQADGELVGRFIRFSDSQAQPLDASYKILQSFDCAGSPASPHLCSGDDADVIVLGVRSGVSEPHGQGETAWIDYGWRAGDDFFVLSPVQIQSATPGDDDSGILLEGVLHAQGVHFTNLGGGTLSGESGNMVRVAEAQVDRWRHVIIRNDTGDFLPNTGIALNPVGLQDTTLGHTNIISNTGHAVFVGASTQDTEGLILEDFSIRHHQDGCFNHAYQAVEPGVLVRRSWCAFVQSDAQSAQWFAWQGADPSSTVVEDSACDACDGGHSGETLRANGANATGWTLRRSLLWAPIGTIPVDSKEVENVLFIGLGGDRVPSAPLLGRIFENSVARGIAIHSAKALIQGELRVAGSIFRDVLVDRAGVGAVIAADDSVVEGSAFLGFDSRNAACAGGDPNCVVLQEANAVTNDVTWSDTLVAWAPGAGTRLAGAMRFRAQSALVPPEYHGVAIAHHDFLAGVGTAFARIDAGSVGIPDWDDGPCFWGNDLDVAASAQPGMPPETSQGIPLGFVDPSSYRFDTPVGSQAEQVGCGIPPDSPAGERGYHYIHARTGLAPELMADDQDGDGWPENIPATPCNGTSESDCVDNCPSVFNPNQADVDGNGTGNLCDAACADGRDNDGDGLTDFPADPQCSAYQDQPEGGGCGLGFEAALVVAALSALSRRRLRASP